MNVYRFDLDHREKHLFVQAETYAAALEIEAKQYPGVRIVASFINVGVSTRAADAIWQPITVLTP